MDDLLYIIDLNEVRGDEVVASRDFTCNLPRGTFPPANMYPAPVIGASVRVHADEDDTLYYAEVTEVISTRDFRVRIAWDTRAPVLREDWSAHEAPCEGLVTYHTATS
jgi:hypothetical protein